MKKIGAFTLAETLITLMVIGVVAALTIPALTQEVHQYALTKQKKVFDSKLKEGLRQMRIDEKLAEKYPSTEAFLNELLKYFKVATVCKNDNLTSCFPETFTYKDDLTDISFNTADIKTTKDIDNVTGHDSGFDTDVMGVNFSDGTRMIVTVNPNCEGISGGDTTGNHTSCFSYVADVSGKKSTGKVGEGLVTNINMSALDFEIASVGAVASSTYGCADATTAAGVEKGQYTCDSWLGAKRYCENLQEDGGGWHLPTKAQLTSLADAIYKNAECKKNGTEYSNCNPEKVKGTSLWLSLGASTNGYVGLWATPIAPGLAEFANISESGYSYTHHYRVTNTINALCVK